MSQANKNERMQMIRLASVIERLHDEASNPAIGEAAAVEAAQTLGATILKNIELITTALKEKGRK